MKTATFPLAAAFAAVLLVSALDARADARVKEFKPYHGAPVEGYVNHMGNKFARGLINICTGIGEVPRQVTLTMADQGPVQGATVGLFKGLMMGVVRTAIGGVEAVMFMVPAPGYYDPMLDPAYVWESRTQYTLPLKGVE
jgi:putative exosortase-associated protein (TIGR04073 family)